MDIQTIKGIIFDYGGTIDSNGEHWAHVLWKAYEAAGIPVKEADFREAYVHGERTLATRPLVRPEHTFLDVLRIKATVQTDWLTENGRLPGDAPKEAYIRSVSRWCYDFVGRTLQTAAPIIGRLAERYPLVLVSNFYGNIEAVLDDFGLRAYFRDIVESAVVGIRKPDPAIFRLGVERLGLPAREVVVIGDSYKKDIEPASQTGCRTIWLKKSGWEAWSGEETADVVLSDFSELKTVFGLD